MQEKMTPIRKPTPQLSLWSAAPPDQSVVLSHVLSELSVMRAEQQRLIVLTGRGSSQVSVEQDAEHANQADPDTELAHSHQLLFEGLNWRICTMDGEEHQIGNSVGIRHIAVLLQSPCERFPPMELARLNGRKCKRLGQASTRLSSDHQSASAQELSIRDSLDRNEAVIDQECDEQLREEFKRLRSELDDAHELKDTDAINRLQPEMVFLMKQFRQDHDANGNIRLFDKREWKRSRGSVANAITRTIESIRGTSAEIAEQIDSHRSTEGPDSHIGH